MPLKKHNKIAKLAIVIFFAIFIIGFIEIRYVFATLDTPNISPEFGSSAKLKTGEGLGGSAAIEIKSPTLKAKIEEGISTDIKEYNRKSWWDKLIEELKKQGSTAFWKAVSSGLNTIAYDTATWLGSGGKGQKPLFIKEDWGTYLSNIGDNAAGTFIESIGKKWNFNLCEPDLALKMKIGLGLVAQQRPEAPACTFSKMKKNWEKELNDPNFLPKFQDMFNPTSNDLGIALSLQTGMTEEIEILKDKEGKQLIAKGGWLDLKNLAGKSLSLPETAKREAQQARDLKTATFAQYTGNAFTDALNVFLNQLAISAYNNLIRKIGDKAKPTTSPYEGDYGLGDYDSAGGGGKTAAEDRFREILEPKFNVRGDYDILAELTMCPDPTKAGPTNCVITDKFRQAIAEKRTVGEAMELGYLNKDGIFGFTADGLEPSYANETYPYRSMIILRKFRILPVGWEVAAQYIKEKSPGNCTLKDLVSCFSANDSYIETSNNCNTDGGWCQGLVDPNWVLKAPLNYCRREGAGPEIMSEGVTGEGADSEYTISRNDNYCGDEQSCIKENEDGSCEAYGYCTEERRKWNFGSDSCEPRYNTCQTFKTRDGKTASYLENTLDYSGCSIDTVGCQAYAMEYNYGTKSWKAAGAKIYLDKDVEQCNEKDEGCHEFIRTKAGEGANLLVNSSFEDDPAGTIWAGAGIQVDNGYDGAKGLQISGGLNKEIAVGPNDYVIGGNAFTFSFFAKNCGAGGQAELGDNTTPLAATDDWNRYQVSYIYPREILGNRVKIAVTGVDDTCVIDAVKLEFGQTAAAYSGYGQAGTIYEKFMPAYLAGTCYENPGTDYRLEAGAPTDCSKFARRCNADEAGCELYTSEADGISVPAKVSAQDYCPAECNGYGTYAQAETAFDSLRPAYFIPATARSCNAEAAGCDEFTNLDKVAAGGEAIEHYSYFRQCVKPSAADANCSEFYSWEGSDETGYQLRVFNLQAAGTGLAAEPALTEDDASACSETIYNLEPSNPSYNADCRQFYNRSGGISYHLYKNTITCSEDCHPYRRTALNIDPGINSVADCAGADKHWDSANEECIVCKSNGRWENQSGICAYNGIAAESVSCSAADNGCREYSGNTGNNMMIVLNNDFRGSKQGWTGIGGTTVDLSNEALRAGDNSLFVSGGNHAASTTLGNLVQSGKSYTLSFVAKGAGAGGELKAKIANAAGGSADFGSAQLNGIWQFYKINLANLNHQVSASEDLIIAGSADFYLDDIKLTEITDRYYLIKNSWATPDSCNHDNDGNAYPLYMLGCAKYADRADKTHYLHSFSQLCQDSAVGCELLIDTKNSTDYASKTINGMTTAADEFIYAVYDENKLCNAEDKGCQRLGKQYSYEDSFLYGDAYLKNNPDKHESILCSEDAVGCEEWQAEDGASYFKDPGDYVCEWRQATGVSGYSWYKKKVNRCGGTGNICKSNRDCADGKSCGQETTDNVCPASRSKTFGAGGAPVWQPRDEDNIYWAGLCPANESGCAELIDPVSNFSSNIIFNSDFSQDVDSNGPDGWKSVIGGYEQSLSLEPNTLYILTVDGNTAATIKISTDLIYELQGVSNGINAPVLEITVASSGATRASKPFFVYANNTVSANLTVSDKNNVKINLRKALVSYQLSAGLDYQSCNSVVDYSGSSCVLFNERSYDGAKLTGLIWDADLAAAAAKPVSPQAGTGAANDSNKVIKVSPDRVCDKWLACRSYAAVKNKDGNEENICFDIGLCDRLSESGNCSSFVAEVKKEQKTPWPLSSAAIVNAAGYAKIGYDGVTDNGMKGMYPLGKMNQVGEAAVLSNGNFEFAGSNGYPIGWAAGSGFWEESKFKIINNPFSAQSEGIGYAPEGRNFLKLGVATAAVSEFADVLGDTDYILTTYINTLNLKNGSARGKVEQFGNSNNFLRVDKVVEMSAGNDWNFKLGSFRTEKGASQIKVTLYTDPGAAGNYYFDDIKIVPALNSRDNWQTAQSCRLYPESDSLSCGYYNDSGIWEKGWTGYCLEYDRYPGSPDACLMWWPVDKVKGDGVEEGAGYSDRTPLYYCLEATMYRPVEKRIKKSNIVDNDGCGCSTGWFRGGDYCPAGYVARGNGDDDCGSGDDGDHCEIWCEAAGTTYLSEDNYAWYDFLEGILPDTEINTQWGTIKIGAEAGVKFYDNSTGNLYNKIGYCRTIAQTVNSTGQNKFWAGRVYGGSNYEVQGSLKYNYSTGYKPFGGIVGANPIGNPYEWPRLPVKRFLNSEDYATEANAGTPYQFNFETGMNYQLGLCSKSRQICLNSPANHNYSCPAGESCDTPFPNTSVSAAADLVKRLFAKSYGSWQWNGKFCQGGGKDDAGCQFDADCADSCLSRCVSTTPPLTAGSCSTIADCGVYAAGNCIASSTSPTSYACSGGCFEGKVCDGYDTMCQNTAGAGLCNLSGTFCDRTSPEDKWGSVCSVSNDCCVGSNCGTCGNVCTDGPNKGIICSSDAACEVSLNCFTCSSSNKKCSNGNICSSDADCAGTCFGSGEEGRYLAGGTSAWSPPSLLCSGGVRPAWPNDYCAVLPQINNIKVNNSATDINIINTQFINLTFNTDINSEQLPMVMYAVDWGDEEKTVVTGVEMRDRPDPNNPHLFYHLYSYWDLKAKAVSGVPGIDCDTLGKCKVRPKIQIKDNWGWCNGDSTTNKCNQWEKFPAWVVVKEK